MALLVATLAHAQIVFTLTATADATAYGYQSGQSYTFRYVLTTDSMAANTNNTYFSSDGDHWGNQDTDPTPTFTDFTSDALLGTYVAPPMAQAEAYRLGGPGNPSTVGLDVGDGFYQMAGLTTLDGVAVIHVSSVIDLTASAFAPSYPETYIDQTTFWNNHLGIYTDSISHGQIMFYFPSTNDVATFSVTRLTIANLAAVPEPSTCALALAAAALGGVLIRRRDVKKHRAERQA